MANKKTKKVSATTVCGALSHTGPGAKLAKGGGGDIYHVNHGKNKKKPS